MRKSRCVWVLAVLLAAPGVAMAVELDPSCTTVFDATLGFDAQFQQVVLLLQSYLPPGNSDWTTVDLESTVPGTIVGDGIKDYYQLGMLGAVLCSESGQGPITAQFAANKLAFHGMVLQVQNVFTQAGALVVQLNTVAGDLTTWANSLSDPPYGALKTNALALAGALTAAATEIGQLSQYAAIMGALPAYENLFAGMAGLSTEMQNTLNHVIGSDLLGGVVTYVTLLRQLAAGLGGLVLAADGLMTQELQVECSQAAAALNGAADLLEGLALPTFAIYGVAKTSTEPFSALGDYNGDHVSNKTIYDAVSPTPSLANRPTFVHFATSQDPYWPGNPGLPVGGLLGLAALSGACALAGAFSIRKK